MRSLILAAIVGAVFSCPAFAGPVNDAAKKGDITELARLLEAGGDVNETDSMASPIHYAALNGQAEAIAFLAAHGAALNADSKLGAPLHAAVKFDRVEAARALLEAGADPNVRDTDQFTPLVQAVILNRPAIVEILLAQGADVDAVAIAPGGGGTGKGPTIALHFSISRYGEGEITKMLRAAGAGPLPPEVPADLETLGNPERGQKLAYTYCDECHTIAEGDPPEVGHQDTGPPLFGVIGRPIATWPGFDYSAALIAHGGIWTPERFYTFALRPQLTVPGTHMDWAPDRTPEMIADITAYLVSVAE